MGKKINNPKLMKSKPNNDSMISAFNQYANRIADSKRKKVQKFGDTKQRLMQAKKSNKMLKVSKRTSKFALLQQNQQTPHGLTHRGKNINDLQEFNDVNFDSDMEDEEFQKMHQNLHFTGFDEEEKPKADDRPKSKTEVYKEIIEKSKLHKHLRQELYEQNLQKATELDQQFPEIANKLQFRTRDSNVRDRLKSQDHQFQKLANALKDDQKVVSNKVIQKSQKYTDKVRQKKTQQLNQLLKDSSEDEGDIRSWVKNVNKKEQSENDQEEDEIDDVQLSSGEQEDGQSQQNFQQVDQSQNQSGSQLSEDQSEKQEEEEEEEEIPQPKNKPIQKLDNKANQRKQVGKNQNLKGKFHKK